MTIALYDGQVEIEFREASHRYKVDGTYTVGVSTILNILSKDLLPWAAFMAAEAFKASMIELLDSGEKITKTKLKELADDAKKAHTRKSQRGKDVGTIVHEIIRRKTDEYLETHNWKFDGWRMEINLIDPAISAEDIKAVENCLRNWMQWIVDYDIEVIRHEFVVHSRKLGYCGTGDVLFRSRRDGKRYLGDYKTGDPQKKRNSRYQIIGHKPYPEHFVQISAYDYAQYEEMGIDVDGYMVIYLPKEGNYQTFTRENVVNDRLGWEQLFYVYQWIDNIKRSK